ncbi:hypothetical protein predicted by Glimmer/Critica [Salmonella enterica subsp. enterica serovar Weltevreden str. 2007-60-3289-1]|nr:hypothetical protein predicted by Glimmer/Critica [Salmonella enterica subsp. enterica serovar Weltevreden str. 2007-60-3289-1]
MSAVTPANTFVCGCREAIHENISRPETVFNNK